MHERRRITGLSVIQGKSVGLRECIMVEEGLLREETEEERGSVVRRIRRTFVMMKVRVDRLAEIGISLESQMQRPTWVEPRSIEMQLRTVHFLPYVAL